MRGTLWLALGCALLCTSCRGPRRAPRESEALARSRLLLERVGSLEAELSSERAATDTFALLEERHGLASEMACKVTDSHVNEMHRLLVAQQEKRREKQRKRQVAAAGRMPPGAVSQR